MKKLKARWSKKERDLLFSWPTSKADGHLLYGVFAAKRQRVPIGKTWLEAIWDPSFREELEARGYDITTLRFEIALKMPAAKPGQEGE